MRMDAIEAILTRRSVRSYTDHPVPEDIIQLLLEAAVSAPSANNQQPWQFIIIEDREILKSIPSVHPYSGMLNHAPLAIVVCGDLSQARLGGYWAQDCSAATQNILLAAHALGLGAVWLGVYPRQERQSAINKIFELPSHIQPFSLISIGHPAEEKGIPDRFKEDRIRWNEW